MEKLKDFFCLSKKRLSSNFLQLSSSIKYLVLSCIATALVACGHGNCLTDNNENTQKLNISIIAPQQYPAGTAISMPALVKNNGLNNLTNVVYSIVNNKTNSQVVIDPISANNCSSLTVNQTCQLMINISSSSQAGSFDIMASNGTVKNNSKQLTNNDSVVSTSTVVGLTNLPVNELTGISGTNFLYASEVNNQDIVLVTMVVSSASAGSFDELRLFDANGNQLEYQPLTGNSGTNFTNLPQGSIVTLAVKVPSGAKQLIIYPELYIDNAVATNLNGGSAKISSPLIIENNRPDSNGVLPEYAIISVVPSNVNFNESNASHVVTVTNTGNKIATGISPSLANMTPQPFTIDASQSTCGSTLAVGASCNYILNFNKNTPVSGTDVFTVNFNDGLNNKSKTSTLNFTSKNLVAGLQLTSPNNPNFDFSTTTNNPIESGTLILVTNIGSLPVSLDATPVTLPSNKFTFNPNIPYGYIPCTPGKTLKSNEICAVVIDYNGGNSPVNTTSGNVEVHYSFINRDGNTLTATDVVGFTWETLQSQAILTTSSSEDFAPVVNNSVDYSTKKYVVTNNGDVAASNVTTTITTPSQFTIDNTTCSSTLAAGASCDITVKFGPAGGKATLGIESAELAVNYTPYAGGATLSNKTIVQANLYQALGAIMVIESYTISGGVTGSGTGESIGSIYQIESQNTVTIIYTVTNIGESTAYNTYFAYSIFGEPSPQWKLANQTCGTYDNRKQFAVGETCTITFSKQYNNVITGPNDFTPVLNNSISWTDQDSPNGETHKLLSNTVYINAFAAPYITFSPESSISIAVGSSKTITATLNGGYNVPNQTVSFDTSSTAGAVTVSSDPSPCVLNSSTTTCVFTAAISDVAPIADYNVPVTITGGATWSFQQYKFTATIAWMYLGGTTVSTAEASYLQLAFNPQTNEPYVAFNDENYGGKITVMKYNGESWVDVGSPGFTATAGYELNLAFNPQTNEPYIAYQADVTGFPVVMKYSSGSWSTVGSLSSYGSIGYISLAFNPQTHEPYVAFNTSASGLVISKYNGSNWSNVGNTSSYSLSSINPQGLAFNPINNQPYVTFANFNDSAGNVITFDGTSWTSVGNLGSNEVDYLSITFNSSGIPYTAYRDNTDDYVTVKKLNASSWENVGGLNLLTAGVYNISLALDSNGVPYVAYLNPNDNNSLVVKKFNGISWIDVGNSNFSPIDIGSSVLSISPLTNYPYVLFNSAINASKASVMYYPESN